MWYCLLISVILVLSCSCDFPEEFLDPTIPLPGQDIETDFPGGGADSDIPNPEVRGTVFKVDPQSVNSNLNEFPIVNLSIQMESDVCSVQFLNSNGDSLLNTTLCRVDDSTIYKSNDIILEVINSGSAVHVEIPSCWFDALFIEIEEVSDER